MSPTVRLMYYFEVVTSGTSNLLKEIIYNFEYRN